VELTFEQASLDDCEKLHAIRAAANAGHLCMRHIENDARREHLRSVRLDANPEHESLLRFYRDQGYELRVRFQAHGTELVCLEKTIIPAR
jgi:hypothetical protein